MSESKSFQSKNMKTNYNNMSPKRWNMRSSVDTYSQFSDPRSQNAGYASAASAENDLVE